MRGGPGPGTPAASGGAGRVARDLPIDVMKGMLVVAMVYGHVLQFFSPTHRFASAVPFIEGANLIAFPGFVFAFGYAFQLAYLGGSRAAATPRLLATFLRILLAFYVSGTFFRVLVGHRPPDLGTVLPIVALSDIPGWSEFLVSFALYALLVALLFPAFRFLLERPVAFWAVFFGLLLTTFFPYERVTVPQLGLLVGTTRFASFPVVQYLPFFLAGMYFSRHGVRFDRVLFVGASLLTAAAVVQVAAGGMTLPGRFPPTLAWILLPMAPVYGCLLLARLVARFAVPGGWLAAIGANALVYLLVSNIVIFAVSGTRAGVQLSPTAALGFAAATIGLVAYLVRSSRPARATPRHA